MNKTKTKTIIILIVVLLIAILCYIGIIKPRINNANQTTTSSQTSYTMQNIYEYVNDIQNNIFSINYIIIGTPEDDTTLEEATEKLNTNIKKYTDYDNYISSLQDNKYNTLKEAWRKYFEEVNSLKAIIDSNNYNGDGIIKNDTLNKYYNIINEETFKLK